MNKLFTRQRLRPLRRVGLTAALIAAPLLLLAAVLVGLQATAQASSHREAPLISKDAYADATDTYAFMSPETAGNLVLIGSWIPFEGPEGGPNYFEWDPDALYDILVDTDGDASPNVTYTLSSRVVVGNPDTFLYNTGPMPDINSANWNRRQFITVTETYSGSPATVLVANKLTAPVNIGSKSTPDYSALETGAIQTVNQGGDTLKVYAGQTDDAFWVDLQVFDLLTLRGQAPDIGYTNGNNVPVDSLSGFNVHSFVVEVPVARLKNHTTTGGNTTFGVWTATRRPATRVLTPLGGQTQFGGHIQVSRLGLPLVNEVVIPLALKDVFNGLLPSQDLDAYTGGFGNPIRDILQKSVEDPELGRLLCGLYSVPLPGDSNDDCSTEVTLGTPASGRADIFKIFLTGMTLAKPFTITTASGAVSLPAGYNVNTPTGPAVQPAEMIRINTVLSGTLCAPTPNYQLGLLGGDACGFPNGRRLQDDVIDIELLAVAGAAYQVLDGTDASFVFNGDLVGVLDDGLDENDVPFRATFPYLAQAQSGQEHLHQNPVEQLIGLCLPVIQKTSAGVKSLPWGAQGALLFSALMVLPGAAVVVRRRRNRF